MSARTPSIAHDNNRPYLETGDLGKDRARNTTSRVLVTLGAAVTNLHFSIANHTYTAPNAAKGST